MSYAGWIIHSLSGYIYHYEKRIKRDLKVVHISIFHRNRTSRISYNESQRQMYGLTIRYQEQCCYGSLTTCCTILYAFYLTVVDVPIFNCLRLLIERSTSSFISSFVKGSPRISSRVLSFRGCPRVAIGLGGLTNFIPFKLYLLSLLFNNWWIHQYLENK